MEQKPQVLEVAFSCFCGNGQLLGEGDGSTKEEIIVGRFLFKIAMYFENLQALDRVGTNSNHRSAVKSGSSLEQTLIPKLMA